MNINSPVYDQIGQGYKNLRIPDPRIAAQINSALGDAQTICNVGAGTGSYEPIDRKVTAVEPSELMISQRTNSNRVVHAFAEDLPFEDNKFDASMSVLSVHHWTDARKGLEEMRRVSRRQVIFTFDPACIDDLWLVRDYLPEIKPFEMKRALPIEQFAEVLNVERILKVLIPSDCSDGFQAAYWQRPSAYLDPRVQASISTLAQLPSSVVSSAMAKLKQDIENGQWQQKYKSLFERKEMDFGYRLIIAVA